MPLSDEASPTPVPSESQEPSTAQPAIANWIDKPTVRHGLLAAGLMLLAVAIGNYLNLQGENVSNKWIATAKYFPNSNQTNDSAKTNLKLYLDGFKASTPAEKDRIQVQLKDIESRARTYASVVIYFYTRLYSAIGLAASTGIISAICLFYITKVGWDKANNYIVNVFIVTSGLTVFVGAFPVIFQQEKNVRENVSLYISYLNLENQVLTGLATRKTEDGKELDLRSIVVNTDKKMVELNRIAIGFDTNSIPRNSEFLQKLPQ